MEWHWKRHKKLMEIDPTKYYHTVESGLTMPLLLVPGVDPMTLHYGMFQATVQKLGSEE
jgi:hypothetical protein